MPVTPENTAALQERRRSLSEMIDKSAVMVKDGIHISCEELNYYFIMVRDLY